MLAPASSAGPFPSSAATFEIETRDEEPCNEQEGAKLTRTCLTKTSFHGDVEHWSTTGLLMAHAAVEGLAAYVGFEHIVVRVHGRSGSFVLHHSPSFSGSSGAGSATLSVAPDSGTGEMRGLSGEARISVEPEGVHSFTQDHDLGRVTSEEI